MAAYDAENYPSRNFVSDAHRRLIEHLLKRFAEYEAKSHPDNGEQGAMGKDLLAFSALQCAGRLVHAVAGWEIDHQVGLALQDWPSFHCSRQAQSNTENISRHAKRLTATSMSIQAAIGSQHRPSSP